jgi:hypothetical protein
MSMKTPRFLSILQKSLFQISNAILSEIAFKRFQESVTKAQPKQKQYYDKVNKTSDRNFQIGELVLLYKVVAMLVKI